MINGLLEKLQNDSNTLGLNYPISYKRLKNPILAVTEQAQRHVYSKESI